MNDKQKKCLWAGIALIVVMGLFPPWVVEAQPTFYAAESDGTRRKVQDGFEYRKATRPGPYSWIGYPPTHAKFVDLYRLGIQYFVVAAVTSGLIVTFKDKKQQPDSTPQQD